MPALPIIDRAAYVAAPRVSVDNGSTLLEQLLDVAKDDESEAVGESLKKLRKLLTRVRAAIAEGVRASATATKPGDLELDLRADRAAKAIKFRLDAWTFVDEGERTQRATEHLRLLYPEGLAFTRESFATQDAEMRRMVSEMQRPELAESLDELVGEAFIKPFKKIAKAYSAMVKAMGHASTASVDLRSMRGEIQTAVVQHATRVLGELEDEDAESVERVRRLLAPIDNFRTRAAQGGGGTSGNADEDGDVSTNADEDDDDGLPLGRSGKA
jgi:hypothetical protein